MNNVLKLFRVLALSVLSSLTVYGQCKQFAYNPFLAGPDGKRGGLDCVSSGSGVEPGADGVTGATNLTTTNRMVTVNGSGDVTQSDVSLASGVLSRAGVVGLSATGANSVTVATNGSTRLTIASSGTATFSGTISSGTGAVPGIFNLPTENVPTALYSIRTYPAAQTGTNDVSWWGYNLSDTLFTPTVITEPMAFFGLESNYSVNDTAEAYIRFMPIGASGNNFRTALFFDFDRDTDHIANGNINADLITFNSGDAHNPTTSYLSLNSTRALFTINLQIGSETIPTSDIVNIGSVGGGGIAIYDETATTGGSLRIVQVLTTTSFHTYDVSEVFTGTPISLTGSTTTFGGKAVMPNNVVLAFKDVGAAEGFHIKTNDGTSANAARINQVNNSYIDILTNNTFSTRFFDSQNVGIGTTTDGMTASGSLAVAKDLAHRGTKIGFFNTTPVVKQTATADAASILALLQAYGLSN